MYWVFGLGGRVEPATGQVFLVFYWRVEDEGECEPGAVSFGLCSSHWLFAGL